jgi:hypothetical protein
MKGVVFWMKKALCRLNVSCRHPTHNFGYKPIKGAAFWSNVVDNNWPLTPAQKPVLLQLCAVYISSTLHLVTLGIECYALKEYLLKVF